jgi:8-oxo-dGTP pyrophosphatase MutT (NUDIX family)
LLSEKQFSELVQKKIPLSNDAYKLPLSKNLQSNKVENSSVLVIVYYNQMNIPVIIFTKRSSKLRNHAGEISFPGGRMSIHDNSLIETAIRETYEEIGLLVSKENVLGCLDPINTFTTKILIFPFVVIMTSELRKLIPNEEVEEIIEIPLEKLMKAIEIDPEHSSSSYEMFKFSVEGHLIWGATARILKNLLEVIEKANVTTDT